MDDKLIHDIIFLNKELFSEVMDKHYNEIFCYVHNQIHNMEDAKDITQDIFIKVYHNLKKYNSTKASFRTWIYRIAHNVVINYQKSSYKKYRDNNVIAIVNASSIDNIFFI